MATFHNGTYQVRAESCEEAFAVFNELARLDRKESREAMLRGMNHGHEFGRDQRCSCGQTLKDYRMSCRGSCEVCEVYASALADMLLVNASGSE